MVKLNSEMEYEIISSPDPDLTTEDLTFQDHCSIILQNIMDTQTVKPNAVLTDRH